MLLQYLLYGSPFVSGHGGASRVFTLSTLPHNVVAHGKWLLVVHTPLILPLVWLGFRSDRWFATLALSMAAATAFPYFFYGVRFDDWEMVRFLLPGIVLVLPVAAAGVAVAARRIPSALGQHLAVVAVAILVVGASARWLGARDVFSLELREVKYPRVGEWFATHTADDAIVFASLHAGSVNYYSARLTLRWDAIPPGRLADVVTAARERGHPTYLVFDDNAEAEQFAQSLAGDPRVRVEPIDRILNTQIARIAVADAVGPSEPK